MQTGSPSTKNWKVIFRKKLVSQPQKYGSEFSVFSVRYCRFPITLIAQLLGIFICFSKCISQLPNIPSKIPLNNKIPMELRPVLIDLFSAKEKEAHPNISNTDLTGRQISKRYKKCALFTNCDNCSYQKYRRFLGNLCSFSEIVYNVFNKTGLSGAPLNNFCGYQFSICGLWVERFLFTKMYIYLLCLTVDEKSILQYQNSRDNVTDRECQRPACLREIRLSLSNTL